MSRFRATKYGEKPKINRSAKGNNIGHNQHDNHGNHNNNLQSIQSYNFFIPMRNGIITNGLSSHMNKLLSSLIVSGANPSSVNQIISDLNSYIPPFLDWGMRKLQTGESIPMGGLSSSNHINEVGGLRTCSACSGDVGSCAGACASLNIDNNVGPGNWNNPSQWKITGSQLGEGVRIDIFFTIY